MMVTRRYTEKDWKQLKPMIMEQWDEVYAYNAACYEYKDPYWYKEKLSDSDYIMFVAYDKLTLCGFILLSYWEDSIEVVYLYVSVNKRRQGVSMALMAQAELHGQIEKRDEIWMHSVVSNDRSHKLKAKLGYVNEMTHYTSRKKL